METLVWSVASILIATVLIALGRRIWTGAQKAPKAVERKRKAYELWRHNRRLEELREQVRECSIALERDVPWTRDYSWQGPGVKILWRSGVDSYYIDSYEHGIGQYERVIREGLVPRQRTFQQAPPKPVASWSKQELEKWLNDRS